MRWFVVLLLLASFNAVLSQVCEYEASISGIPLKVVSMSMYDKYLLIGTQDPSYAKTPVWYLYERKLQNDEYVWEVIQNGTSADQVYANSVAIWGDIMLIGNPTSNVGEVEVYKYNSTSKKYELYYRQTGSGGDMLGRTAAMGESIGLMGAASLNRVITKEKDWNVSQTLSGTGMGNYFVAVHNETIVFATEGYDVVIFDKNPTNNAWTDKTSARQYQANIGFGKSVSFLDEDHIVITAWWYEGSAYVYERNGSNYWVMKGIIEVAETVNGDQFGATSAASDENFVVIGAPSKDISNDLSSVGVVYIFEMAMLSNGTWASKNTTTLFAPTVTLNEQYGSQIAIHQDLLAVASGAKPATVYIYNCPSFSDSSSNNNNNNGGKGSGSGGLSPKESAIVAGYVLFFAAIVAAGAFGFLWHRNRREPRTSQMNAVPMAVAQPAERITIRDVESANSYDSNFWEIDYKEIKNIKKLGNGAFGVVYLATWRNAFCAVKQMIGKNDSTAIKQFQKEASHMQKLRPHPHVLGMLGVCTNPKYPMCIVTEFMNDGSLYDLLHNHNITIDGLTVLDMATQIASGLSHLHSENILHKDLATRNVLIMKKGNGYHLKIADFGMGTQTSEEVYEASSETKFPVRWSPPEVISSRIFSVKSDIWSYGVTVWEILERKTPYPDLSNKEVIDYVCNQGGFPSKPTLIKYRPELWDIMFACFQKGADLRPTAQFICEKLSSMLLSNENYYNTLGIGAPENYN